MITDGSLDAPLSELAVLIIGLLTLVAGLQLVYLALKRKASLRNRPAAKNQYETL